MRYYFLALGTLVIVCIGCSSSGQQLIQKEQPVAPPPARQARPGPMVDGPGPGVMPQMAPPPARSFASQTTQVRFLQPEGMQVGWKIQDGYAEQQLVVPGRYNFEQGKTYRLKFTNIPDREGVVVYPTLQVYPAQPQTDAYLSHNSVPIEITAEDLDQVETNNFVTKVIYLPDPKFQELAIAGVETLVSTRLEPGVDPISEADRRGSIMVVLRLGNLDLEMPSPQNGDSKTNQSAGNRSVKTKTQQAGYVQVDGDKGQYVPPVPIGPAGDGFNGIPGATMVGGSSRPGRAARSPVSGRGGLPKWGMPMTGTPIGLPGPPHVPLGGPAGLKSHTVRNMTPTDIPKPVDHMLIDVRREPGYKLPKPVKHIEYTERHPVYRPGEVSRPAWAPPK